MDEDVPATTRRVAIELDRLSQEIGVIRHVLDDAGPNCREETVRRLGYLATRARRIAELVENEIKADAID